MSDIDELSQIIRQVDGDHTMGAGALAEEIVNSDWYAAELRRAKAEALREMADELEPGAVHQSPYVKAGVDIIRCILNRADQIEKEATE